MMTRIKYFTILGERNSGTHFLQYAMLWNFRFEKYIKGSKHFFGFDEYEFSEVPQDELLYICIVRDPIEWIDSYFKRLHFAPKENRQSIMHFLTNTFYSIHDDKERYGQEIMEDRHLVTRDRYKNIFEMRKVKYDYLLDELPKKVQHYYFLRYEDLRDDYENTLDKIYTQFELTRLNTKYIKIEKIKGTYTAKYEKKPILLNENIKEYIRKNVDLEQENRMGYLL